MNGAPGEDPFEDASRVLDGPPVLSAGDFAAPLDWLLEMARTRRLDLARLPVGGLIGSFAESLGAALAGPEPVRLERWAEWLVMAATLTLLWSRLVPTSAEGEDPPIGDGRDLLGERQSARDTIRALADWLEQRPQLGREVFRRGGMLKAISGRSADITELLRACLVQLRVREKEAARHTLRLPPFWRVNDAIGRIERLLGGTSEATPLLALLPPISVDAQQDLQRRAAVASTVVAALEMSRRGAVILHQAAPWDDVRIEPVLSKPPDGTRRLRIEQRPAPRARCFPIAQ